MTTTDDRPVLRTPTGGAESRPQRPEQWHGHPYVWAWNVSLGATSPTYIEGECKAAKDAGAPPDAVYRTRDDDPSMPGEWITVGMMVNDLAQQRVREYAQALVDWQDALKAYRPRPVMQPLQAKPAEPQTDESESAETEEPEYEYAVTFTASFTGVVTARSLLDATKKMTPGEKFAPSGYGVLDLPGDHGVLWHAAFDSCKGTIVTTTDPRISRDNRPAEAPAAEKPAEVPTAAEDTAGPTPTAGRGVRLVRRRA
ncbi:hypothetical protein ACLGIH_20515 [Streptomyces sp. HMX87]|uniref:hypothetical protein n=1 Tax=Streptomyces sp. HMX87 TaxID=3390849 RepID=UPI003A850489